MKMIRYNPNQMTFDTQVSTNFEEKPRTEIIKNPSKSTFSILFKSKKIQK